MRSAACAVSVVPGKRCGGGQRRRRCNATLESSDAPAICRPRGGSVRSPVPDDAESESEEEGPSLSMHSKDLVVVVDEDGEDSRTSFNVVSECELEHWEYHEPPYGEKLGIGFAMLASEPAQL